jgi:hypothetical protein
MPEVGAVAAVVDPINRDVTDDVDAAVNGQTSDPA